MPIIAVTREEVRIMDVEKIYDLLLKLYAEQEQIKINYKIVKVSASQDVVKS